MIVNQPSNMRILVIAAHPDDAEICMGGTISKLTSAGHTVKILVGCIPADVEQRTAEAGQGAATLGATLGILPGGVTRRVSDQPVHKLVADLDREISAGQPDIIFTHWEDDAHPDHRALQKAVLSCSRLTGADLYTFGPPASRTHNVLSYVPNVLCDISNHMERKLQAIRAHQSQVKTRSHLVEGMIAQARWLGVQVACEYAEGFRTLRRRI